MLSVFARGLGIVGVGACIALGVGHGVAAADTDTTSGSSTASQSSETPSTDTKTVEKQQDSPAAEKEPAKPTSTVSASTVKIEADDDEPAGDPTEAQAQAVAKPTSSKHAAATTPTVPPETSTPEPVKTKKVAESQPELEPAAEAEPAAAKTIAVTPTVTAPVPAMTAAPPPPNLINVVGTLLFTLVTLPLKLLEQTPVVPPGYSVTVGQSTLDIGCGCGQKVDARWYFPDPDAHDGAPPQSIIYLQHGFIRSNSAMSAMAIEMAEKTNSVVVTPTLTSNPFTSDGCWINGEPMQRAVADLFVGDRTALTQSAVAAGWTGGALPQKFVLAGHSAGGGLAAAAAGYAVDNHTASDLLLVVMLDGVPTGDALPTALAKLTETPVFLISSPPYIWNSNGLGAEQLVAARPGQFVGVQLAGGSHVDYEGASSDFLAELACGFSRPENVKAAQDLAVGWINDAVHGSHDGIYGLPGQTVTIPTAAGDATASVLGASIPAAAVASQAQKNSVQNRV